MDEFHLDFDFFDNIGNFLDEELKDEDSSLLAETVQRLLQNGATDIKHVVEKRIALLPISSEGATSVIDDMHWDFRLAAQLIFDSQGEHELMRSLISIQLKEFQNYYVEKNFGRKVNLFDLHCQTIANKQRCQIMCLPFLADLFQVKICDVRELRRSHALVAISEYLPSSPRRLETFCDDDYLPRKTFYVNSDSTKVLRAMNVSLQQHKTVSNLSQLQLPKLRELMRKQPFSSHDVIAFCRGFFISEGNEVVSANEDERLNQRIRGLDFEREDMLGDGNCMLRSLSHQVLKSQERHVLMRNLITARFLYRPNQYNNLPRFRPMKVGPREQHREYKKRESWRAFRKRMSMEFEWGNGLVLQAAADAFCIKISVVYSNANLVMVEYLPQGKKVYFDSIFLCVNSTHMDSLSKRA